MRGCLARGCGHREVAVAARNLSGRWLCAVMSNSSELSLGVITLSLLEMCSLLVGPCARDSNRYRTQPVFTFSRPFQAHSTSIRLWLLHETA
eukprot:5209503-Alexandrium_andersonii.AAC.1